MPARQEPLFNDGTCIRMVIDYLTDLETREKESNSEDVTVSLPSYENKTISWIPLAFLSLIRDNEGEVEGDLRQAVLNLNYFVLIDWFVCSSIVNVPLSDK